MKGIHQVESKREIPLCHIQSSRSNKNSQLEKFSKTKGKWPTEFPREAKAENSQNVSFHENWEEIPTESLSKGFDTDSRESILNRRYLV